MAEDPLSHVLLNFPSLVTRAGRDFYEQQGQDMRLLAAESMQAEALLELTEELGRIIPFKPTPLEPRPQIVDWGCHAVEVARSNMPSRMQQFISMAVDNYQTYLTELCAVALRVPRRKVERALNKSAYRGFPGMQSYFRDQLDIALVADEAVATNIRRAVALRNLLVHRRGVVDERLINAIEDTGDMTGFVIGQRFTGDHHVAAVTAVMEAVRDIDLRVMETFSLPGVELDRNEWIMPLLIFRSMKPQVRTATLNEWPDWP